MLAGHQTYRVWLMLCSEEKRAMEEQRENETAAIDGASILPPSHPTWPHPFFCLFCFQHPVSLCSLLSLSTPTPPTPRTPPHLSFSLFLPYALLPFISTAQEQSLGEGWQQSGDVMPAVQRWQLNLFSEIPQISIFSAAEQCSFQTHPWWVTQRTLIVFLSSFLLSFIFSFCGI